MQFKSINSDDYNEQYMKNGYNSDDDLSLEKILKMQ